MVDEEAILESLAVVQYEKCDLCRRNHRKGKGHVYTKAHRTVLQNIISKFSQKVSLAKKSVKVPGVHSAGWEVAARRWCYFCKTEVQRHHRDAITAIQDASFLRHLASEEHKANTLKFWREQRLEKDKHTFFLVEENKLEKYEAAWKVAVNSFLAGQEGKRKTEAARIARQDVMRGRLVMHQRQYVMSQIAQTEYDAQCQAVPSTGTDTETFVRTVAAKAAGLTVVAPRAYDKNVGNIYSGAPPPWMQSYPSDLDRASVGIGPTQDDLKKHLENERKRKLPATRVGAKFDHQGTTGAEWLPSFGRVWSSQRRTHGQKHFMQALKKPTSSSFHNKQRPSSATGRAETRTNHTHTYLPTSITANTTSHQRMLQDVGSGSNSARGDSYTHHGSNSARGDSYTHHGSNSARGDSYTHHGSNSARGDSYTHHGSNSARGDSYTHHGSNSAQGNSYTHHGSNSAQGDSYTHHGSNSAQGDSYTHHGSNSARGNSYTHHGSNSAQGDSYTHHGSNSARGDPYTHHGSNTSSNHTVDVDPVPGDSVKGYRPTHSGHPYHSTSNGRGRYGWACAGVSVGYSGGGGYHSDRTSNATHTALHAPGHVLGQTYSNKYTQSAYNGASHGSCTHQGGSSSSSQLNNMQQQPPKKVSRIKIATSLLK